MANGTKPLWALLDGATDLIQITALDGRIVYVNPAWCQALGYNPVDVHDRSLLELLPANGRDRYRDILQTVQTGETTWAGEVTFITHTGQVLRLKGRMSYHPVDSQSSEIWSVWQTANPVPTMTEPETELNQELTAPSSRSPQCSRQPPGPDSTTLLSQQNHILQLIARDYPLPEILTELAYLIEQQAVGMLCSFLLLDDDGITLRHGAAPSLPAPYNRAIDGLTIGAVAGSCGTAAYRQAQVIVTDIASDPLWANFRHLALAHGLQACWSTPIFAAQGQVLGTFAMYYQQPRRPNATELHLIHLSTDLASIAIERHRAKVALHTSEERLRLALDSTGVGSWDWDIASDRLIASDSALRLVGLATGEAISYPTWLQQTHPDDRAEVERSLAHAIVTHTDYGAEYRVRHPDGSVRWLLGKGRGIYDAADQITRMVGVIIDITDRKRVEDFLQLTNQALDIQVETQASRLEALSLTDQNLRLHIENSPLATIQWDCAFRVQSWSPQAEVIFGWSADEVLGKPFTDIPIVVAADRDQMNAISTDLLKGGKNTICSRNYTKSGTVIHCEWYNSALTDATGNLISILSLVQDVTIREQIEAERAQAESKLRQSEAQLQEAQRVAQIGNWEFDPATQTIGWSAQICCILGLPLAHSQPSLQQAVNCFHPSDRASVVQAVEQTVATGAALRLDARIVRPDGSVRYVEVRGENSTNREGQTIRLFGTLLDITERKVVEASLRESEERFRQLAENTDEVFFIHAADLSEVIYISPAYEVVWQRDRASLYQQPTSWLETIHADDLSLVRARLAQMMAGEPAQAEYRILLPDGTIRWINARSFPIYDESGQLQRHVGLAEDVTATKRAAAEIHKALTKEKELNELKSRFVSMISHEFRTPLTTIQSAADLLQYYEWSKVDQQERFHQISTAVQHMTQLLEDVLLIGKADAGKLEFNPTLLNLTEFCQQLAAELQLTAGDTCQINFQVRGDRRCVWVDQKLIRQIATNLLSNAIKYSSDRGKIGFKLDYQAECILLQIQDHGIGIPLDAQEHLFEAFYRATNVNEIQGTGLGLAIVKKCVDLYGGTIAFNSEVGVGSTFTVSLPLIFY